VAQIVRREKPENPVKFKLMYFLVCQSIELSLKAYLRGIASFVIRVRRALSQLQAHRDNMKGLNRAMQTCG
jgi:hypothetical protein